MKKQLLTTALALAASVSAMAGSFYAGVGSQHTHLNAAQVAGAAVTDDLGHGLRILAGYRVTPTWAVEAAYGHAKSLSAGTSLKGHETSLAVVGTHPVALGLSAIGKVGISHSHLDTEARDHSKNSLLIGAGVSYTLTPELSVRTEWERTQNFGRSGESADKVAVSLVKTF